MAGDKIVFQIFKEQLLAIKYAKNIKSQQHLDNTFL
ncbi:hypothetical protein OCHUTO_0672 [Orientia chuto str. Dubai]|uniref:Uncharacterized protein n=1 Tax=Orientia chuto str. Dubai TaxID=1359168 RepID=A0A0F3MJU7_9RICK|nr:hypothetical protein OCHUTO_0672 [Orientia chuto str. Dubai]